MTDVTAFESSLGKPVLSPYCPAGMRRLEGFKVLAGEVGLEAYWRATGDWSDYCRPVDAQAFECF